MEADSKDVGPSLVKTEQGGKEFPYLACLNPNQLKAVTASPSTPLQILAGPGSGKTRVLTSRVAYLVQYHGYRPNEITAVTFTNKAANEMKKRLTVLLGEKQADALVLGTFHATCARYLRRYGQLISLNNNFSISDADDCKKIMSRLIKEKAEVLEAASMSLKDTAVLSEISKAKAKGESPDDMAIRAANDPGTSTSTTAFIAELYAEYEASLREANSLDFDDLLVFGLRLFRTSPHVLEHCKHILVDEFQDTNTTQYELMRCFAEAHNGVSVVGDPDQSIYGWRSAEVENLNKMTIDFPGVEAIYLEENYRSTGSILAAAHSVVSQDRDRIQKNLYTTHPKSTTVTLKTFSTPIIESSFIATEIKRLIAYSGGVLNWDDFAILLRYNALSRTIESALQKDSIPNRIVGGHKFFERMEIKDLLAYLQLADNPGFTPAFVRVVNVPRRAIGDKSVADLLSAAKKQKISPMELCERMIDGDQLPTGIKPAIKKNLASFVGMVRKLRRAAQRGTSVADLLRLIIEKTGYEEHLRKTQQDFDSRWENVQELITFSVTVAEEQSRELNGESVEEGFQSANSAAVEAMVNQWIKAEEADNVKKLHPMFRRTSSTSTSGVDEETRFQPRKKRKADRRGTNGNIKEEPIDLISDDEEPSKRARTNGFVKPDDEDLTPLSGGKPESPAVSNGTVESLTPLGYFLQTSMLATDTESQEDNAKQPKLTITTVHAAKGLEWPVVFIPAVEQGTYPSYRCVEPHEIAEERRLLYVAMTRAQVFLTMSHCNMRMLGGEDSEKTVSEFITHSNKKDPGMFSAELADIDENVRRNMAKMLARPVPDEVATKDMIMKHVRAAPPLSMWDAPEPQDRNFNRFARREITKATRAAEYWASDFDEYALPGMAGAAGAKSGFQSARAMRPDHDRDRNPDRGSPLETSPKKAPPKPVKHRSIELPAPMPFTFGQQEERKPEAGLGAFTSSNSNFLANLDSLGVGDPTGISTSEPNPHGSSFLSAAFGSAASQRGAGIGNGHANSGGTGTRNGFKSPFGPPSPQLPSAAHSQKTSAPAVPDPWMNLANLGPPDLEDGEGSSATGTGNAAPVQLARGTKRLGMGRPSPWGSKR